MYNSAGYPLRIVRLDFSVPAWRIFVSRAQVLSGDTGIMAGQELQHFAAKVYLRAFIDPALKVKSKHQIWTYSRGVEPVARGVREVAAEYDYYEVNVPGTEGFAEKEFGKVETAGSPILKKLRKGDINLTAEEKNTFALFVAMSMARVPVSRELIDVVQAETSRKAVELIASDPAALADVARDITARGRKTNVAEVLYYAEKLVRKEVAPLRPTKFVNVNEVIRIANEWQHYLAPMVWGLCEAPDDTPFITSDNPVHVFDEATRKSYDEYEGPTTGLRFTYPLSPRFALTGQYVQAKDQVMSVDIAWVAQANQAQVYKALRQVYASFRSTELWEKVNHVHSVRKPIIPQFPLDVPGSASATD